MVTTPLDGQLQTRELTYIIKLDAETDAIKEIAMKTKKSRPNSFSHRYMFILLDPTATVVSGGQGVTNVTTNPQTFTYAPNTPGSYKVSLTNLPNDISQTPAGFTVLPAPTLSTYTGDCTTSKTQFNLGETVC